MTTHPRLEVPSGGLVGGIICESFRPGSRLEGLDLRVTAIARYDITGGTPLQPTRWTLIEFDGPESAAGGLATQLSSVLLEEGGWYANFSTSDEAFVVFADKIFRYDREGASGRAEAEDYARGMGVPEPQLDWSE